MFLPRYKEYILTQILGEWTSNNKGQVKVSPNTKVSRFFAMFPLRYKEYILNNILEEWTSSNEGLYS